MQINILNPSRTVIRSILAALLLLCGLPCRAQYADTNGIFAEFNTSMGSYTCRLEFALAPLACANFIGLATGQRAWLDLPSGVVKTNPFYDGTMFHRVIAGFMNQGGSPNALGTDGPGYSFVDEFNPIVPPSQPTMPFLCFCHRITASQAVAKQPSTQRRTTS